MSEPIDIHTWFSLTYANYLVLPRSVLQSMPEKWQHRFTAMLGELDEVYGYLDWPTYDVRALAREPEQVYTEPCEECEGCGHFEVVEALDTCKSCEGEGVVNVDEPRRETANEVGFRTDPIPHYNRGRTYIPADGAL